MLEINKIYNMNCLDGLRLLDDDSIDALVTDPPYGLAFMNKKWDTFKDNKEYANWVEEWAKECLRVLKPGGHLLAFSGTRTYHALAWGIESAGFEIRDMIEWLYMSGFPKSMDVGKQFDKLAPRLGMFDAFAKHFTECWERSGLKRRDFVPYFPHYKNAESIMAQLSNWKLGKNVPSKQDFKILQDLIGLSNEFTPLIERVEAEREKIGEGTSGISTAFDTKNGVWAKGKSVVYDITAPATPLAKQWDGWGTALKPAHEPIVMARKPLEGTVCANVEKYGTGAINVDGCRIGDEEIKSSGEVSNKWREMEGRADRQTPNPRINKGRFPANCVTLDDDAWYSKYFNVTPQEISKKASKKDRGEGNNHPTVKPIDLMSWLIRLVTPPNGTVLDPFAGSGSTLVACKKEGFNFIGFELDEQYIQIIEKRIADKRLEEAA